METAIPPEYKATPLPASPTGDFMTQAGWETLFALIDGAFPAVVPASKVKDDRVQLVVPDVEYDRILDRAVQGYLDAPSREVLAEYLESRPIDSKQFRDDCISTLASVPLRGDVVKVMNLMSGHAGSLLLTGHWTPPAQQPVKVREQIVKKWATSRLATFRLLAKTFAVMAQKANCVTSPYLSGLTDYSDVPRNWEAKTGYDFKFIQVPAGKDVYEVTTDVVIVGSGPGGGVSARNLAEAGHKVIVADKGYYFPPSQLPMSQNAAAKYLYDNDGLFTTDTGSTTILCGSCWGGGGTINWSVCLKPQDYVREEWAASGLPLFTSPEFDECIDRVWKSVGASNDAIRHNHGNRVVLDGAKKLGWHSKTIDQNTGSKEHYCGQCHLGCGMNEKRGPTVAWLPGAADAGAQFMEGFQVDKVVFAADGVTATGVEGTWTGRDAQGDVHTDLSTRVQRKVRINARKVVVSSGSIQSPVLLAKSGVKNKQVGRNLHLHPCNLLTATFKDEERAWEGGIITAYSGEFENLDKKGHGVKIETLCMVPYTALSMQAWNGGLDARLVLPKYRHLRGFISLVRDRDTGRVYPDPVTGKPRIDYSVSPFDAEHGMDGLEAIAKLCYVMGATEIRPHLPGTPPFVVDRDGDPELQAKHPEGKDPEFTDPAFGKWLKKMRQLGNSPPVAVWSCAHQMGSNRMSSKPETGVVDERGKVWNYNNLYVADSSVFPSATGVNPMITVMSIADWISRGIAKELKA